MKKIFLIFLFLLLFLPFSSAAHYIVGAVNNATDGTPANDHRIVLWNSLNGISDNVTDIIGPNGNSGADLVYFVDCELLSSPCSLGDELSVRVYDSGDSYVSSIVNVTVTGAGYDLVSDLTLNSPPNVTLILPSDHSNVSQVLFNCSVSDYDSNLYSVSLYGNWSGGWHLNETKFVSGGSTSVTFSKNISEGDYDWNCFVKDDLDVGSFFEQNYSFVVDLTSPTINNFSFNASYTCGTSTTVRALCNATDNRMVENVTIMTLSPSFVYHNYSASFLSGDTYYSDILLDEVGVWNFTCYAQDFSSNFDNLSKNLSTYSDSADLFVTTDDINFSKFSPVEDEVIQIQATVHNDGCSDANNVLTAFYNGNPLLSGFQLGLNQSSFVGSFSSSIVNVSWSSVVGSSDFFVKVDVDDSFLEFDEGNNIANKTFEVPAWQDFYGNISSIKILSNYFYNLSSWLNSNSTGNIFIADSEANIDWTSLVAIGRNVSGGLVFDDFSSIDSKLGMSNFNDSVSNLYSVGGVAKTISNFSIHDNLVENVPIINSTNNSNFITGILWDSSDDGTNGEYDVGDSEDLVFVSKINQQSFGKYGEYDFELTIPVELRRYDPTDSTDVYLYYELI